MSVGCSVAIATTPGSLTDTVMSAILTSFIYPLNALVEPLSVGILLPLYYDY